MQTLIDKSSRPGQPGMCLPAHSGLSWQTGLCIGNYDFGMFSTYALYIAIATTCPAVLQAMKGVHLYRPVRSVSQTCEIHAILPEGQKYVDDRSSDCASVVYMYSLCPQAR